MLNGVMYSGALLAWAAGGWSAARELFDPGQYARRGWTGGWLLAWVMLGLLGFVRLFVLFLTTERLQVDTRTLTLRRALGAIGRTRVFDARRLGNVHFVPPPLMGSPGSKTWPPLPVPRLGGSIRFEYGRRAHEFAFGVGWEDMGVVLNALRERIPVASSSVASE